MVISNLGGLWTHDLRWGTGLYNWAREQQYAWYYSDLPEAERPGREPDALFREILELEDVVKTTTDSAERDEAWRRHNLLLAESCWIIGLVANVPTVMAATKGLRNVWGRTGQDKMLLIWPPWDEQYWIRGWFLTRGPTRLGVGRRSPSHTPRWGA